MARTVIDNRYKILKKCGTGATGTVYKVKDLNDKKIIVLKILSPKKISSEAVQRYKREFGLLAGLRHPNLCTVYDFGMLKDGRSYFTMEYIDGQNIFKASKGLSYDKSYSVRKNISNGVYAWIVQLCRVLEYIHSKGLIHYDIKPGNVLIQRSENTPSVKLMDFGLAGEQRIKGGTIIKGTFPYIAPELIKGLAVDHRADLYSLGILLYEIFTRRSLKVKDETSFATLLQQQRESVSELLSKIVVDMPKRLEQLIMRLLSLEPAARFSHANEVIKEINKISRAKFALETEKTIEGYLLSSRFVGREKEMDLLTGLYEKAHQGEGRVVLITGDAGIGKTRLLKEFKIFTQLKRSHCFTGYAHRDKTGPLEPFYDIFKELINYLGKGLDLSHEKKLRLQFAVLFKIFPDLPDGHLKKNLPKLVPLGPQQDKLRNFEALSGLIGYSASCLGELVILLEDLHWADDLSIQFLEYLGRNIADRNILICATSRRQELKENVMLKKMIHNLKNENRLHQIELGPLNFKSLYSFLDSTITSESNSSRLARYLMKRTGGNPFFAEEILRILLQKRGVTIGKRIGIEDFKYISVPGTIEGIVLKRIKDLDRSSQKVVKFAAVLLKGFDYDLMRRLTGLDDTELSKVLWTLKRRQVLIEQDNRYQFYHATLREAINKRMAYREKRKMYYQTGKTLEHIYKRNTEGVVEDLAYYFINAKDKTKGVRYGIRAAKKSKERYANEQAIKFYKGVLGLLGTKGPKRRLNILYDLAQIEKFTSYYKDAIKHYNKALILGIGTIDQKIDIYNAISWIYVATCEYSKALHIYRKIIRLLQETKPSKLRTLWETFINLRICRMYLKKGNFKKFNKFNFDKLKFTMKGLKKRDEIQLLAMIYGSIASIELDKAKFVAIDYDKLISYIKKAYKCFKKINDERNIPSIIGHLGIYYRYKFDLPKAIDCYQKSIKVSEKIGEQGQLQVCASNLGECYCTRGYYAKALNCYERAFSFSEKIGNTRMNGVILSGFGDCFLELCNYQKAKEYFERAIKIYNTFGYYDTKAHSLIALGDIYQAKGDYNFALRCYRKSLKISKSLGVQIHIRQSYRYIGSIFLEIGELSKAKKYIDKALNMKAYFDTEYCEVICHKHLCRMNIIKKNYAVAAYYYNKGMRAAKQLGLNQQLLKFLLLIADIYYHEKKYLKGFRNASKAVKLAKDMGTRDLHAEALLMKAKNGVKQGLLSKIEAIKILDEAKRIAEEIGCPEVLWKVYFAYGRLLQDDRDYLKALEYYTKCIEIFKYVRSKIKNETYKKSYINRIDRQAVVAAINEI